MDTELAKSKLGDIKSSELGRVMPNLSFQLGQALMAPALYRLDRVGAATVGSIAEPSAGPRLVRHGWRCLSPLQIEGKALREMGIIQAWMGQIPR